LILPGQRLQPGPRMLERLVAAAEDSGAAIVYSDFRDDVAGKIIEHALIDYQPGSIRDNFDFGSIMLISKRAVESTADEQSDIDSQLRWAGLYDLRLKLSINHTLLRVPEPLYTRTPSDQRATGEKQFDYVDPRQQNYQREMENVATEHLKRIGAYLAPEFAALPKFEERFSARASVVIPVRNRERTIKDAVRSALSQKTSFSYNVIVVDNHSTDRTTEILSDLASSDSRLIHMKPERTDLGIGGCWNEAIYSEHCGEYAVQLDSDDLYADEHTLERVVAKFGEGLFAMVIGSYTIVNFELQEIPPGLIDHREWTRENGRNNALRINGLGAPRAFYVPLLRRIGLPNVSYGEDYAAALRISRDYEIGRIYDSIYFARRWEGNSDAALPVATANRYDAYKDHIRTVEILARKRMNQK
jgi:Glycosyl transferase family 2